MNETHAVRVDLGARSYDVVIGAGLLSEAGRLIAPYAKSGRVFIVTDETIAQLHLDRLNAALGEAGLAGATLVLPPGEEQKSFPGLERVTRWLLQAGADRGDIVVAFGGGVIGDLVGFAAGVAKRGMDFVQIPTTLLAQVDSSVGGKTAIDTPEGKNLVGLFHQPRLVLADLGSLATLRQRQMRAGYAEIVKYGLIDRPDFYDWLEAHGPDLVAGDPAALAHAVKVSVESKARIVAADEREGGVRALLNLGHTFAHALETAAGYDGALLHGEAVGAGMALAFDLSVRLGYCEPLEAERVRRHLSAMGFTLAPAALPGAPHDVDTLMNLMASDKKAEAGRLTFILARGVGRAFVQKNAPADAVRAFLEEAIQA